MDGAVPLPLDSWATGLQPIDGRHPHHGRAS